MENQTAATAVAQEVRIENVEAMHTYVTVERHEGTVTVNDEEYSWEGEGDVDYVTEINSIQYLIPRGELQAALKENGLPERAPEGSTDESLEYWKKVTMVRKAIGLDKDLEYGTELFEEVAAAIIEDADVYNAEKCEY